MTREDAIIEMKQYFNEKAEVGIFWYNPIDEELFEVHSMPASSLKKGEYTYPKLHKTIWNELYQRAKNRKKKGLEYESIYLKDYTQVPRGRIFLKDAVFYIFTGSWVDKKIQKMIIKRFNLQKCEVVFKIDTHWELGHGWSSEEDILQFD